MATGAKTKAAPRLSEFAELLSQEVTPNQAAVRMGLDPSFGSIMLRRLREALGPQAR